jgi:hypothetical protein
MTALIQGERQDLVWNSSNFYKFTKKKKKKKKKTEGVCPGGQITGRSSFSESREKQVSQEGKGL